MLDIIIDTLIDSIKLLPFLFLSYLLIEFIEHKSSKKLGNILKNSGKFGPVIGSILGCVPQCGFSVTASNLFSGRVITLGTLIAVFLSTSDEAIPVLLSHPNNIGLIIKIILIKLVIGLVIGTLIDFIFRTKKSLTTDVKEANEHIHQMCSHCDCEHGIFKSAIKHTISIFLFIVIVAFVLNSIIAFIGEVNLSKILMLGSIFQPFIAGVIGLIPNCASSVILTELYLSGSLSIASLIAGLCAGSGLGIIVLFRVNKNLKENLKVLAIVYLSGVSVGILIQLIEMILCR
ncbi:MAG: putative manganese transporter [Clostridia bacterium]